ncbi:LOW QUALITY PROTEIN: ATP-binding cassette sub-family F member 3-like [Pomacea canaliculata]|uniref:LOW QUALITY PROTEIN: ATP-binding cassette sub-family F member 3-like n=1 Tax=Pomacea canaliculata TaxID=400727 RepID=UPI000D73E470|nr:LOW QUALITY PROTEIN: ATP-binding cassette sub-family F member 3-like [Pomacea canaliculata]
MAAYRDVLTQHFPSIDREISDYVSSILEDGGDDFGTSEDLFDAIGMLLQQADDSKTEDEIKIICSCLHSSMNFQDDDVPKVINGVRKVLDAPVHLASLAQVMDTKVEEDNSIWMKRRDMGSTVNQKKLEKAEAKIQKKQGKRSDAPPKEKNIIQELASASQQINKRDARLDASGTSRSLDIKIENFDIAFGDKTLLTGANIHLVCGRRYGLIGRNGLGKTTLLKLISSRHLKIPSHISVLHVEQEVTGDDTVALQSVLECDEKRESLLAEEKALNQKLHSSSPEGDLSERLQKVYQELEAMESDKAPSKAAQILNGLGFSPKDQQRPTREFSGGWRMRLALARALFTRPDLLLLDEPTNMLDMKAIIWLENYLQDWPKTILVVSHDRQFLNSVATDILHLHSQRLDVYRGNYEVFYKTREEKTKNQMKEYEAQKQYREHIQVFIDRFRYNANRASQVQSKLKLLEKLPELKPIEKETEVVLRFPECEKLSPPILQLDEVTFYYTTEKVIFSNVCLNANMTSRICIVGENGAGKTTLLKLLLGELSPVKGIRHAHRNLRIGYFTQHHVDQLDMNVSSVELMASKFPGLSAETYRGQLGKFGVSGDLSLRPVVSLSGGQKSRVAFAVMSAANPNFFVLDEPTNHLDMETIEALGEALRIFEGGVVLVSHDERLIRKICSELWVVSQGSVRSLEGGIDEYKALVQAELDLS